MCWCTPSLRTPFCGKPECHPPTQGEAKLGVPHAPFWSWFCQCGAFMTSHGADVGQCETCGDLRPSAPGVTALLDHINEQTRQIGAVRAFIAHNFGDQVRVDGDFAQTVLGILTRFKPDARFATDAELFVGAVEIKVNGRTRTVCSEITYEQVESWTEPGVSVTYRIPNGADGILLPGRHIAPVSGTHITAVRTDNA